MPNIFVSHFPRKVPINNYKFQLLVVSATPFYPVWRGLDNFRSNPGKTRDKKCSTWETKITVPCRITATLPPAWAYTKLVFISMYSQSGLQMQWFWKLDKGESTVVVAVTASHCPGLKPSVKYLFWVVQNQYKKTQQLRRQRQIKASAAEAVTTALCPGPGPSDNTILRSPAA